MSNNRIDTIRHLEVFSPQTFRGKRVDVIGCGATGSKVCLELAKLGIDDIHAWDFDVVESHNIANQAFGVGQIGQPKVDATASLVSQFTNHEITTHNEAVDGSQQLGDVVFVLTDTMASRKQIFYDALRYRFGTDLMIETRMGADNMRIYAVRPNKRSHVERYEQTLYDDDETQEETACGASTSVGPTSSVLAGLSVWQMIRWFSVYTGDGPEEDVDDHEMIVSLRPFLVMNQNFNPY